MKARAAILFDNLGPYHMARLKAAATVCDIVGIEFGSASAEYAWNREVSSGFKRITLNKVGCSQSMPVAELSRKLGEVLDREKPEVIFVPGWSSKGALISLQWALRHRVPTVLMSESTQWDEERNPFKEWVKAQVVSLFSAALVGGSPHRQYLQHLGFPEPRIFVGYDAVDNDYFEVGSAQARSHGSVFRERLGLPHRYFLASARFIAKKNLPGLLASYAAYRRLAVGMGQSGSVPCLWDLVLLGDGDLRAELEAECSRLGLGGSVQMPGFKQYGELPAYYGLAEAFVHASASEQWGLVVNEAMACGLPVLVSERCGCACDLVHSAVNGWTFDPTDADALASLLAKVAGNSEHNPTLGAQSRAVVAKWGPARFAEGVLLAVAAAKRQGGCNISLIPWILHKAMLCR